MAKAAKTICVLGPRPRGQKTEFGEGHGHAFRGNQHTGGIGSTEHGRDTLKGAEEKLRAALPNAYPIDLSRLDAKLLPTVVEHVQKFASEYPRAAGTMLSFEVADMGMFGQGTSASTEPSRDGTTLTLNAADWGDLSGFRDTMANDTATYGHDWLTVNNVGGVLDHELGHVLDFAPFVGTMAASGPIGAYSGMATSTWANATNDLSGYANTAHSAPEAFAEGFAAHDAGVPLKEPYNSVMNEALASARKWEAGA